MIFLPATSFIMPAGRKQVRALQSFAARHGIGTIMMHYPLAPEHPFPTAIEQVAADYRALIDEFRCPKCLNANLSGSDAPIAHDLRLTVHRLLVEEGMSDQEVRDFLQARYGDFVLYDPPFKPSTWLLWLGPIGFLLLGAWALRRMVRQPVPDDLSAAERDRLDRILRNAP